MALTGKPVTTPLQVGGTIYWTNGGSINSGTITKIVSKVTNPAADSTGVQDNIYFVGTTQIPGSQGFHSKNALLYSIKGDYLNKWTSLNFSTVTPSDITIGASNDFSYSDFTNAVFTDDVAGVDFNGANLDGCKFSAVILNFCDLSNCSMKYSILTDADLTDANMAGVNLYGATLPKAADSKSAFKALVADYTGAIWTDGTVVT